MTTEKAKGKLYQQGSLVGITLAFIIIDAINVIKYNRYKKKEGPILAPATIEAKISVDNLFLSH